MPSLQPSAMLLLALLIVACAQPPERVSRVSLGSFDLLLDNNGFAVARRDGVVLAQSSGTPGALPGLLGWREASLEVKTAFGMFMFNEQAPDWTVASEVSVESFDDGRLELRVGPVSGVFEPVDDGVLRVVWTLDPTTPANRLAQGFACPTSERFHGLGALVHGTEHSGEVISTWVSEQGIGKLRRANPYDGYPLQGDIHDTYLSVPFVISSKGFGLLVEDSGRSRFHLRPPEANDRWVVESSSRKLSYLIIDGPDLQTVLRRLTAITGRPRQLPDWALAPWVDAVHGPDQVLAVADKLRQEGVPASAIWTEDWIGGEAQLGGYHLKYQWEADTSQYPDLKGLAKKLHDRGFRFLGYFNPFIEKGRPQWNLALKDGHTIKDKQGQPLSFVGPLMHDATLPDLTRPETRSWVQGFLKKAVQLGFDGWMADYGEWLPVEARLADGSSGAEAHNRYPIQWQKLHREIWDQLRPDGDYLFFVRSGWTGTGGIAPVVWAGDQQTQFAGLDGMASVIPLMVNAGMSGIPVMTHDIAGYSTVGEGVEPTTKELFFRWTELGALSPIMRTHHGALADKNWHWDKDAATIAHFRSYARLHTLLFPYRKALARQAAMEGLPMVRHLVLHYGGDRDVSGISDQYLLGPSLLVAPVLEQGATGRKVYLPSSAGWFDFFSGERHPGGGTRAVSAPLERIPVFAPAGAIVPMLLTPPDTLDRVGAAGPAAKLVDLDDANDGGLALRVFLGADGTFALADGTNMTLRQNVSSKLAPKVIVVDGKPWPGCSKNSTGTQATSNCWTSLGDNQVTVYIDSATGFEVAGDALFSFEVAGAPQPRRHEVTFYF